MLFLTSESESFLKFNLPEHHGGGRPSRNKATILLGSHFYFFASSKMTFFHKLISFPDIFFHNMGCLFRTCCCASAHARHVLAFVVSRFSAGNRDYLDNNKLYPDNIEEVNSCRSAKTHQV